MAADIDYGFFDPDNEDPAQLWNLYKCVYGSDETVRRRWNWEVEQSPLRSRRRIIVARDGDRLVGQSVRLPVDVVVGKETLPAEFAVDSMVHPDYRGRGIIQDIYRLGFEAGILQLSKGTAPGMYRLLMKMGYHKIKPDTFMVSLLRPFSWCCTKILKKNVCLPDLTRSVNHQRNDFGFRTIDKFLLDWDLPQPPARVYCRKTPVFLNWRYIAIPHQKYTCCVRECDGRIMGWYVLHLRGTTAYLVDLGWDEGHSENLDLLVLSAKNQAYSQGAVKISFWGNCILLRRRLEKAGFRARLESPGFSCFSPGRRWNGFSWSESHFVHGDGDIDYL